MRVCNHLARSICTFRATKPFFLGKKTKLTHFFKSVPATRALSDTYIAQRAQKNGPNRRNEKSKTRTIFLRASHCRILYRYFETPTINVILRYVWVSTRWNICTLISSHSLIFVIRCKRVCILECSSNVENAVVKHRLRMSRGHA